MYGFILDVLMWVVLVVVGGGVLDYISVWFGWLVVSCVVRFVFFCLEYLFGGWCCFWFCI